MPNCPLCWTHRIAWCVALTAPFQATAQSGSSAAAMSPLARFFEAGGPIIIILAILAVLALGVAIVKAVQFVRIGVGRSGFVSAVVLKLRVEDWKAGSSFSRPGPIRWPE